MEIPVWRLAVASFLRPERRDGAQRWIKLIPLGLVLIVQVLLTLRLNNTAFRDEGLYIYTGHREIAHFFHGAVLYDKPETYFSGSPVVYPVIAAMIDRVGGLMLVRLFSLLFMLAATASIYSFSKRLFTERVGLVAAVAFALAGPTMHLGNFATFDAMALGLIAISTALGVRAVQLRSYRWFPLVAVMLSLAVVTKYASLMFVPFALGAMFLTPARRTVGVKFSVLTALLTTLILVVLAKTIGKSSLAGIRYTTTKRSVIERVSLHSILSETWHFAGPWWLIAFLGVGVAFYKQKRLFLPILFAVGMIAPMLYQAHIHENVSLDKHLDFGLVFGAPLIGLAATAISRSWQKIVLVGVSVWLVISGLATSRFLYGEWANTSALTDTMSYALKADPYIHTLGDVYEPVRYHFEDSTQFWQWDTTDSLFYQSPTKGDMRGLPAAEQGLADHYWQYVYLDGTTGDSQTLMKEMGKFGYKLTDKVVLHNNRGDDTYYVWQNFDPKP
jgi:4-amino-4-deoxy-L-arabinose transferase-like glycosyltransferase